MPMNRFMLPLAGALWSRFCVLVAGLCLLLGALQADALNLTGIELRKTHGAAGTFLSPVDGSQGIAGAITVEGRDAGMAHQLVFHFDAGLMLAGTLSVTDETGAAVGMSNAVIENTDVVVFLVAIPDNKRVTVRLTNVNGQGLNVAASIGFLLGDVNNSRSVSGADVVAIKARSGQVVGSGSVVYDLNASGVITAADITAAKARNPRSLVASYTLGGNVSGLMGALVLQNNGGSNLTVSADGTFTFAGPASGAYNVSVLVQPMGQYCTVGNASGTISSASVTNVAVACTAVVPTSIYAVKSATVADGSVVAIGNALVTGVKNGAGYFIQVKAGDVDYMGDAYSGIFVATPGGMPMMAAGMRVNVIATVVASGGGFQLNALSTILSGGGIEMLPTPPAVGSPDGVAAGGMLAGLFEGIVISVSSALVTAVDMANGEFTVSGGLVVDDYFYLASPLPAIGDGYVNITGFLRNVNGVFKLLPRSASDLVGAQAFTNTFVTYLKPLVADPMSDPPGFFVQSSPMGPSLFVAIDPAVLMPAPAVGDAINFQIGAEATLNGLRQATSIIGYSRASTGNAVGGLAIDISAISISASLDFYQSMLVKVSGSIVSAFSSSGPGYVRAALTTAGQPMGLEIRLPSSLVTSMGLASGCTVTLDKVPVWRNNSTPQISAWSAADFTAASCPAPQLVSAIATSANSVQLQFNRNIDAASVLSDGSQFTANNGLTVSNAVAMGTTIFLTTSSQMPGVTYTVTVAGTVTDTLGTAIEPMSRNATFVGYVNTSGLVINEVDYDNVGTDTAEFIEIYNGGGSTVDLSNLSIYLVNGATNTTYTTISLAPAGALAAGEYLVIGTMAVQAVLPPNAKYIAFALSQDNIQNGAPDGIALVNTATLTVLDSFSYEGAITAAVLPGFANPVNLVRGTALTASVADSNTVIGSLCRLPNGSRTNNDISDWIFCTMPTPGAANAP